MMRTVRASHAASIVAAWLACAAPLGAQTTLWGADGFALRLFALMAPRRDTGIALPFRLQDGGLFLGPARIGDIGAVD